MTKDDCIILCAFAAGGLLVWLLDWFLDIIEMRCADPAVCLECWKHLAGRLEADGYYHHGHDEPWSCPRCLRTCSTSDRRKEVPPRGC